MEVEACGHACVWQEGCHSEGVQGGNAPKAKAEVSEVARSTAEPWGNWACQQAGGYRIKPTQFSNTGHLLIPDGPYPHTKNYPRCTGKFTEKQGIKAQGS